MSAPVESSSEKQQKVAHPQWFGPFGESDIRIHNSLTSTKVPFLPSREKFIGWYTCGPTVYDSAHLGHARCYVTFDIIRRILADYFKYNIFYVMNITDIDDKIIIRSRRNYLLADYTQKVTTKSVTAEQVEKDVTEAFRASIASQTKKIDEAEKQFQTSLAASTKYVDEHKTAWEEEQAKGEILKKEEAGFHTELKVLKAAAASGVDEALTRILKAGKGPLSEYLDSLHGANVTDHTIFKSHASYYEKEFIEDMRALNVRDADALTRVTEYVQQIITYVQGIIKNGFAYEAADGSVYFDTQAFQAKGFAYAKLSPWSVGNKALTQSGEGSLSCATSNKKHDMDFALWKTSKKGEPSWDSPWGAGRPGWHIECSAMASDLLGTNFDVHSGGTDLKFPHHDNELAQSESHSQCKQWVNHFWHAGHLNIQGLKMSKSLKNFITIRDVLRNYSGRVIRFLFLLTPWDTPMNFSDDSLKAAATKEKEFNEFFANTSVAIRAKQHQEKYAQLWNADDRKLHEKLIATRDSVDKALRDNFDYPRAMALLSSLISDTNKYYLGAEYKTNLLTSVSKYIDSIVRVFGVVPDPEPGFVESSGGDAKVVSILDGVAAFRDAVRDGVRNKKTPQELLALCDAFRDETMLAIGVRMEDVALPGGGMRSVWKMDDPEKLLRERQEKKREELNNRLTKLKNKSDKLVKDLTKLTESAVTPRDFFATQKDAYSKFDETGKPTHDQEGKELTKSALKGVVKVYDLKDKANKDYLSKVEKNPKLVEEMKQEIEQLKAEQEQVEAQIKGQGASSSSSSSSASPDAAALLQLGTPASASSASAASSSK